MTGFRCQVSGGRGRGTGDGEGEGDRFQVSGVRGKGAGGEKITLPRWDGKRGTFLSGQKTIRGEFERLVKMYAVPGVGSAAIGAADPSNMPKEDILGNPRGTKPDVGCYQTGVR